MKRIAARALPAAPLSAQAAFNAAALPAIETALASGTDVLILFDAADHTHREWRRAAVAMLARAGAPLRVNALAGPDGAALENAAGFLAAAPGVTGQYLALAEIIPPV